MKELPDDLSALDPEELARQGALRDQRLTPLFRRWPALSRMETRQLKALYDQRLRIARYLGRFRR